MSEEDIIVALYRNAWSAVKVAAICGVTKSHVLIVLARRDEPRRTPWQSRILETMETKLRARKRACEWARKLRVRCPEKAYKWVREHRSQHNANCARSRRKPGAKLRTPEKNRINAREVYRRNPARHMEISNRWRDGKFPHRLLVREVRQVNHLMEECKERNRRRA